MRVLILPALLAVAVAAPSGELKDAAPLAVLPVVTPTIDPGDIQAAAINAQVAAEDQARAAVDKIVEENNEKVIESDSLVKEKTEETFWAGEDKKWQALDAVQTAAAKIDGAVASNADAIARSALGGVIIPTYIAPSLLPAPLVRAPIVPGTPLVPGAPIIPGTPITGFPLYGAPVISPISPLSPLVYTPGLIAKKEDEKEKQLVKTAEPEKDIKVVHTVYSGIVPAPGFNPISSIVYTPGIISQTDEKDNKAKTNETEKDNLQIFYTIYRTHAISPISHFYYNAYILKHEDTKETEKEIVNAAESDKDNHQVLLYPSRILTASELYSGAVVSPLSPFYSPGIIVTNEKHLKDNEIENNAEIDKEENNLEEKKEKKPLEKADKDKLELEKPLVSPLVPLVAPQPWPLSPVAPVYVPQQVLTQW